MIAAFVGMWILGAAPVQNNPYVVSNGSLQYLFFILGLYVITKILQNDKTQFNKKNFFVMSLISLSLPMLIFIQRLVIGYDSVIATLSVSILPFVLIIYKRGELMNGGKLQLMMVLLTTFTFITMLHPFQSPTYVLLLISYVWLWKLIVHNKNGKHNIIIPITIILGSVFLYILQTNGLVEFTDNFFISKNLFGSLYEGTSFADVSFTDKVHYLEKGSTSLILVSFLIGGALMFWHAFKGNKIYLVLLALCALSFLIYFIPEGLFIRSRFLIPLISLVLGGGASVLIKLCENQLNKIPKLNGKINSIKLLSSIIILLAFVPILYDSTTTFRTVIDDLEKKHQAFATFMPYEYEAGKWLRENLPRNTLVISDPFSINLMTQISGLKAPYERKWVLENEYPEETLKIMSEIRSNLLSRNNEERIEFLNKLIDTNDVTSAIIIINDRTEQWLTSDKKLILVTYGGLKDVQVDNVPWLTNELPAQLIYNYEKKMYIYKYNPGENPNPISSASKKFWRAEADGKGNVGIPILIEGFLKKTDTNNSLKITPTVGSYANWRVYRNFNFEGKQVLDWSNQDVMVFYWYGEKSDKILRVTIGTKEDNWSNTYIYDITEDWRGYKQVILNLHEPTNTKGSPDISQVIRVGFSVLGDEMGDRWLGTTYIGTIENKDILLSTVEPRIVKTYTLN
jgi:hypothetical protein